MQYMINGDLRWPNDKTDAGLCELQEVGSKLGLEITAENWIALFYSVTVQRLQCGKTSDKKCKQSANSVLSNRL